jgi:hypothetical protein
MVSLRALNVLLTLASFDQWVTQLAQFAIFPRVKATSLEGWNQTPVIFFITQSGKVSSDVQTDST